MTTSETLIPARFLFRFAAPCRRQTPPWTDKGSRLSESHRLMTFDALDGARAFADIRVGWSEEGLAVSIGVHGKRHAPWCHESRIEDSDGLRLWVDTRDTHNIHRASRFCHAFIFLPSGGGRDRQAPIGETVLVNRAKENAKLARPGSLGVLRQKRADGYGLDCFLPAAALAGYDPDEHPRLGFNFAVLDRELGVQTFSAQRGLPYQDDPSLWGTLELMR